jgi:hypothetical protein
MPHPRIRGGSGERLGCELAMLQGVLISLRSTTAGTVHSANTLPTGAPALFPAPLRSGVASQRLVYRPVHGIGARAGYDPPLHMI